MVPKPFDNLKVGHCASVRSFSAAIRTREHHLNEVSFVDVFCWGQPLQDVLVIQVVAEKQDLVVHAKEAALWELERGEDTGEDTIKEKILEKF